MSSSFSHLSPNTIGESRPFRAVVLTPPRLLGGFFALCVLTALALPVAPDLPSDFMETRSEALELLGGIPLSQGEDRYAREEKIARGERFDQLLARLGIADETALRQFLARPEARTLYRQMVPGRLVRAETTAEGGLLRLEFPLSGGGALLSVERADDHFVVREIAPRLETRQAFARGEILHSFFGATDGAGIPDSVAQQMVDIFSGEIDFHRDLRRGDRFDILYEQPYLAGSPAGAGRILAARFVNSGKTHQAFWFAQADGRGDYYSAEGNSLRKAFMRSPLPFSRVTSGFALRLHPILKTWRAHKGMDYGAPSGTPVRATGDGVVRFVGRQGGYGQLVVLAHMGQYQTAYAHLSRFAPGLKTGSRVTQNEVIGYVGQTGWATGPHLHYEFRVRGQAVNPLSVPLPTRIALSGAQKEIFLARVPDLESKLNRLSVFPVAARFE
ncbi:MAG: M23 family metallopeptidase [Zoogloeaceae bacterium]|jgi:murein DD-endopeptidase MepM/ murein hydrolase activator NlpD|nr:M23 family metallopeptidase [Zoogloeaceae bacterium]